jgi:hypothetical protein
MRAGVIVVGLGLFATGCNTDREVTEPEPVPITDKRLTAALVTAEDVPGFTAAAEGTPISTDLIPEHECDDAIKDLEPEEAVSADFTSGTAVLTNTVAWFPGGGGNVDALIREIAEDCAAVVVAEEDLSLRTSALDFGVLSDDTLALKIEAELADGTIEERDLILVREGDLVSIVRLTGPRPSDKELLDSVTRVAIGNLGELAADTS